MAKASQVINPKMMSLAMCKWKFCVYYEAHLYFGGS